MNDTMTDVEALSAALVTTEWFAVEQNEAAVEIVAALAASGYILVRGGIGGDDEEAALAYAALQEAIRHAAMLRTESVTIQTPLARYIAARLADSPR